MPKPLKNIFVLLVRYDDIDLRKDTGDEVFAVSDDFREIGRRGRRLIAAYEKASAEWNAWDIDLSAEWSQAHEKKREELCEQFDLHGLVLGDKITIDIVSPMETVWRFDASDIVVTMRPEFYKHIAKQGELNGLTLRQEVERRLENSCDEESFLNKRK